MKPVYTSLSIKPGALNPGIYKVEFAPKEWLLADPVIDFQTGAVKTVVPLVAPRAFLTLTFAPLSHKLQHRPKGNKGGPYHEITFTGLLNDLDATTLQVLNTIRYNELVLVLHDRKKFKRIIGDTTAGMVLQDEREVTNTLNGGETLQLTFSMESELPAPFYLV